MLLNLNLKAVNFLSKIIFGNSCFTDFSNLRSACDFEISRKTDVLRFDLPFNGSAYLQFPLLLIRRIHLSLDYPLKSSISSLGTFEGDSPITFFNVITSRREVLNLLRLSKILKLGIYLVNAHVNHFLLGVMHPLDSTLLSCFQVITSYFCVNYRCVSILSKTSSFLIDREFTSDLQLFYEGVNLEAGIERLKLEGVFLKAEEVLYPEYLELDMELLFDHLNTLLWRDLNLMNLTREELGNFSTVQVEIRNFLISRGYVNLHPFPLQERGFLKLKGRDLYLSGEGGARGQNSFFYHFESPREVYYVMGISLKAREEFERWSNFKRDLLDLIDFVTGSYRSRFEGLSVLIEKKEVAKLIMEKKEILGIIKIKDLPLMTATSLKGSGCWEKSFIRKSPEFLLSRKIKGKISKLDLYKGTLGLELFNFIKENEIS